MKEKSRRKTREGDHLPMTKKETSWDDIPSLDGLEVDWEYQPNSDKRQFKRVVAEQLQKMFHKEHHKRKSHIPVRVRIEGFQTHDGALIDISEGGARIEVDAPLYIGQKIRFGTLLDKRQIVAEAVVRSEIPEEKEQVSFGLKFDQLAEKDRSYICDLVSGIIFQHNIL
jgi:c-di-GMP-binding flagellar brake protein YcgR